MHTCKLCLDHQNTNPQSRIRFVKIPVKNYSYTQLLELK